MSRTRRLDNFPPTELESSEPEKVEIYWRRLLPGSTAQGGSLQQDQSATKQLRNINEQNLRKGRKQLNTQNASQPGAGAIADEKSCTMYSRLRPEKVEHGGTTGKNIFR